MAEQALAERKIYEPEWEEENDLPEAVLWENIIEAPQSVADLNSADGAALAAATAAIDGLGALAYEDLVNELLIADAAITNAKIAINAIQGDVIAAGAIVATKISDGAIETAKLAAGAVVASKIAAGTITANEIAASTITASKMNVSTLSAITANLGTVNAGNINGLTITGGTIRTASSGTRIQLDDSTNEISIYSGSTKRARGYQQGWDYYNSSGTLKGSIYVSSNDMLIAADITSTGNLYYGVGSSGSHSFHIGTGASTIRMFIDDNEMWLGDVGDFGFEVQVFGELRLNNGLWADMAGIVSSSGVMTNGGTDALTWSVNKSSTGVYQISHGLGTSNYLVIATPFAGSGSGAPGVKVQAKSSSSFTITTYNDSGTATDFQFYFMVILFN